MGHPSDGDREDSKDNKEKFGPLSDASTRQAYAINEPANSTLLTPCEGEYHNFAMESRLHPRGLNTKIEMSPLCKVEMSPTGLP